MLPSVRKDLEDLEARLDTVLNKQLEIEATVNALRPNLIKAMQVETDHLIATLAEKLEAHNKDLSAHLSRLHSEVLEQGALDKTEIVAAIAELDEAQQKRIESLTERLQTLDETLKTRTDESIRRVEEFEAAWRDDAELQIDDTSEQSVREWSEKIGTRLKKFGESKGMPRYFAWQLLQELKELTELNKQFADDTIEWEDRLDDLQRALFAADRSLPWTCLTPHNATAAQRRELRVLETAVAQMRSYGQERLREATGISPLEIVPRLTPFDASLHESNEFLDVPTDEASKHNLILSVEQTGFQQISPGGEPQLLRPARVRRYVLQHQEEAQTPVVGATDENIEATDGSIEATNEPPAEDDVPRVSGQL